MTIPIEFVVSGRPSSVNGKSAKKLAWKTRVSNAGNSELTKKFKITPLPAPYSGEVTIKVFFFPHNCQYTDIDNGLKHTIDALCPHIKPVPPAAPFAPILKNDRTVLRLTVERFAPSPGSSLVVPVGFAPTLARALMTANGQASLAAGSPLKPEYATAIKLEPYIDNNGELW